MTTLEIAEIKSTLRVLSRAVWWMGGATAILVLLHAAQILENFHWSF